MSLSLSNAVQAARASGIIVVAAAGNDSQDNDLISYYPANLNIDNIVAVAASTRTDTLYALSNFGSTNVDLAAPGYEIYSTTFQSDESYGYDEGTSIAAGFITGTMALLRASFPLDSYSDLIQRLLQNVDPLPGLNGLCASGGRLNLRKALGVPLTPPLLDAFSSQDQLLGIRLSGASGRPYILERSTNFTDWVPVMTNYTGFDGTFLYQEGITNSQKKFYRAFQSP
jgi:subtilisin family serine protease